MKIYHSILYISALLILTISCSKENSVSSDPGWNNPGSGSEDKVVIMSYNTHHCAPYDGTSTDYSPNESAIAGVISSKSPDIVFLQEMDKCTTRSNGVNQPKVIAEKAKYPYYEFFKIMDYRGGEYGLAILSKKQLTSPVTHTLPSVIDNVAISGNNAVGTAVINLNGTNVLICCLHLSVYAKENEAQLRYVINNIFEKTSMPIICAGDFNSLPSSATIALLDQAGFKCTNSDPSNYTIPSTSPNREIDFIAYRPVAMWSVLSHIVIKGNQSSDHLPIVSSIKITK